MQMTKFSLLGLATIMYIEVPRRMREGTRKNELAAYLTNQLEIIGARRNAAYQSSTDSSSEQEIQQGSVVGED